MLWVYRDGKRRERTQDVLAALLRARTPKDALVACGEIESALADAGGPSIAHATDAYARRLLGESVATPKLDARAWPDPLVLGTPEGFAYYALDPLAFAAAMTEVPGQDVLVVGVRSIGTTLSAIAAAALTARGVRAERVTVRPDGPASARRLGDVTLARDYESVLVVDEGPGLSGSTLLAAAEAYARAGARRVIIVCTRPPAGLPVSSAARFRAFRAIVASAPVPRPKGKEVGGGRWRSVHGMPNAPACPAFERPKVLVEARGRSDEGGRLWKYDGLGLAAMGARERARALADERISMACQDEGSGWHSTRWQGRPLESRELDAGVIDAIVRSCVVRTRWARPPTDPLRPVIVKNARLLFGMDEREIAPLDVTSPALVDGRLAPHEFLRVGDQLFKTDALTHGDDHFFPGPTDIAWDLAGAIVEWRMNRPARELLLDRYRRASGDDASGRIDGWLRAYEVQRAALVSFAPA